MTSTVEEIKDKVIPVVKKWREPEIYLFVSYARGDNNETSDVG
ncbi:MAG: nucleotidyltransferase domain-containing protein [Lactobacillales bacterium]|jgi:predicted nucleotidyltransferase|nr:nucleotidyltransferase domain-containing protein [Lactobacillales bacterium]